MVQKNNDLLQQISANITTELCNAIMDIIIAINNTNDDTLEDKVALHSTAGTKKDVTINKLQQTTIAQQSKVKCLSSPQVPQADINLKTGRQCRRYCYTCICCNHWGRNCKNKGSNHKDEATFRNRMGGSNKNCLPVTE